MWVSVMERRRRRLLVGICVGKGRLDEGDRAVERGEDVDGKGNGLGVSEWIEGENRGGGLRGPPSMVLFDPTAERLLPGPATKRLISFWTTLGLGKFSSRKPPPAARFSRSLVLDCSCSRSASIRRSAAELRLTSDREA